VAGGAVLTVYLFFAVDLISNSSILFDFIRFYSILFE